MSAVQTMMGFAKDRPDPKIVSNWLVAYLGKRPREMKLDLLKTFTKEATALLANPADTRAATLVLKVIEKVRENVK